MPNEWRPITDYETPPEELADGELHALVQVWTRQRARVEASGNLAAFMERLRREWAIETGLIERLYTLERGITASLIERGVDATLLAHHGSDNSHEAANLIRDQEDALESVFSFVKGERTLSTSYIKELHQLFTRHQESVEVTDQFGKKMETPLLRGEYKKLPNNPVRPDGKTHFYSPPEHTAAEIDRLLSMHHAHDATPEVEAAWLHHRFTQIHPFQDGNGRLARTLATLIFLKAGWLPLTVHDSDRNLYIDALEAADEGDLQPLVSFFSRNQQREILKGLDIANDILFEHVHGRIEDIGMRAALEGTLEQLWETPMARAEHLRGLARDRMEEVRASLARTFQTRGELTFFVDHEEDQGLRSHYFSRQVSSTAEALGHQADLAAHRSWARLVMDNSSTAIQRNLLISFHGLAGQEFAGMVACSATWFQRTSTGDREESELNGEAPLCDEVFLIGRKTNLTEIECDFQDWLREVMERGLAMWETTALK